MGPFLTCKFSRFESKENHLRYIYSHFYVLISFVNYIFIETEPKIIRRISQPKPLIEPDEPTAARRSPSPPRKPVSNIVHIRNLVRPFTLIQLKELLKRTGNLVEDGFWIDNIKSHCIVTVGSLFKALFKDFAMPCLITLIHLLWKFELKNYL